MLLIPTNLLRLPRIEEIVQHFLPREKQREFTINPSGGFLDVKDFPGAIRRASAWDRIFLPEGEYTLHEIKKTLSIHSMAPGTVIKGPLNISSDHLLLSGMEVYAPVGQPAISLERGVLLLEDCVIKGEIKVGEGASLFMRNCIAGGAEEGISAASQASVEVHTSRLSDCKVGLSLRRNSSAAIYHSRIDHCLRPDEGDAGAAIYAENSNFYGEGLTMQDNNVGLYLKDCPDSRLLSSHLLHHKAAAIIATGRPEDRLTLCSCHAEQQDSTRCSQIVFSGGVLALYYSAAKNSPAPALFIDQARLEVIQSQLFSNENSALEAQSCEFSVENLICKSPIAALNATGCRGLIRKGIFHGSPPLQLEDSPELLMENCQSLSPSSVVAASSENASFTSIEHFIQSLNNVLSHEDVCGELERILRLAHAAQQRKLAGLPETAQSFHAVFTGTTGTGKLAAARVLADGLFAFGITAEPGVQELDLSAFHAEKNGQGPNPFENLGGKIFFLSARRATGLTADLKQIQEALFKLSQIPQAVLILEGDRDEMRRLIRGNHALERAFSRFIHFPAYGPIELTALFCQRCQQDHIPMSEEAALCCLLLFHVHCDRRDRRFTTVEGVMALYEASRQRYLERCSHQNRFDLKLSKQDLDLPPDKAFRFALERSPAFVSFCPSCGEENSWVLNGEDQTVCLHCGTPYTAAWGLWKESASYRRARESINTSIDSGAISRRIRTPVA